MSQVLKLDLGQENHIDLICKQKMSFPNQVTKDLMRHKILEKISLFINLLNSKETVF